MNCAPSTLPSLARCFKSCDDQGSLQAIKSYILCKTAVVGINVGAPPPAPTGFAVVPSGDGILVNGSWDAPPAGVTATNVYKSTDGVNYSLYTTVAAPATTASDVASTNAVGAIGYYKIAWAKGGNVGPQTAPQRISGRVSDWARRCIVNGSTTLIAQTMKAMNAFDLNLMDNGVSAAGIVAMNCYAPDNWIAGRTPLYKAFGNDPWASTGFGTIDLSNNGLKGDGSSKYLDTGVNARTAMPNAQGGLALYCSESYAVATVRADFGGYETGATVSMELGFSMSANNLGWSYGNYSTLFLQSSNAGPFLGFLIGMATGSNPRSYTFVKANGTIGWTNLFSSFGANAFLQWPSVNIFIHARNQAGAAGGFSDHRISFACIFSFYDPTKGQALYNAVQALRWNLGGGYVGASILASDTFESYTPNAAVNGLIGGTGWTSGWIVKENFTGLAAADTFESYTPGVNVAGLTGGTNYGNYKWNGPYVITP